MTEPTKKITILAKSKTGRVFHTFCSEESAAEWRKNHRLHQVIFFRQIIIEEEIEI